MARGATVCVTGASGFIASWLVKTLLERGYHVKGTVRNPEKAKFLMELPGASESLELVAADLLEPGSFDSILQGCDGVFHTASPLPSLKPGDTLGDPEAELVEPALKGTLNVLEACAKARPKRIVLTSSIASMFSSPKNVAGAVIDESFWSDPDIIRKSYTPAFAAYRLGKTLAEKAAWEFVKQHNLNMVVINPVFVIGPTLLDTMNSTNELPFIILNGTSKDIPNRVGAWVGVKDVVKAHILGYEKPDAEGRYPIYAKSMHYGDLAALLQKLFPLYNIETREGEYDAQPRAKPYVVSTKKLTDLGLEIEPLEQVLQEMVASFEEHEFLNRPQ
jgi:nucleoside-diphosphate-sugar epimerase